MTSAKTSEERFIDSLTLDELRYIVHQFWVWFSNDGCPYSTDAKYKCRRKSDVCSELNEADGCWVKYYLWKYRQKAEKEKGEK